MSEESTVTSEICRQLGAVLHAQATTPQASQQTQSSGRITGASAEPATCRNSFDEKEFSALPLAQKTPCQACRAEHQIGLPGGDRQATGSGRSTAHNAESKTTSAWPGIERIGKIDCLEYRENFMISIFSSRADAKTEIDLTESMEPEIIVSRCRLAQKLGDVLHRSQAVKRTRITAMPQSTILIRSGRSCTRTWDGSSPSVLTFTSHM